MAQAAPQRQIRMQPGKQEEAASCPADILIYGGAAGAGKTFWEICEPLRFAHVKGFSAVFFRRLSTMLTGGGSAFEEAKALYPSFGGRMREGNTLDCRFPSGAMVEFTHLQHEKDLDAHQSKQYALIIFDELTHFTEKQFWYMLSRNRTTCGVKPYIRAGCNPDPDSWVAELIAWWIDEEGYPIPERSGVLRWFIRHDDELHWFDSEGAAKLFVTKTFKHLEKGKRPRPKSFTFIAASLDDNPELEKHDPDYRSNLMALPKVERLQLLGGNWKVRRGAGGFFKREWVNMIPRVPDDILEVWRCYDKAATEATVDNPDPDYTASVLMGRTRSGRIVVMHAERYRFSPGKVQTRMLNRARADGPRVKIGLWQDPGGAGKSDVYNDAKNLSAYVVDSIPAREKKGVYFMPFSSACENGLVDVVEGDWNSEYFAELENFRGDDGPTKKDRADGTTYHDDWADATSGCYLRLNDSDLDTFIALSKWNRMGKV